MKKFILLLTDIVILYFALWLTLYLRYQHDWGRLFGEHLIPFSILFLIWLIVFYIANFYDIHSQKNGANFYVGFTRILIINAIIGIMFFYLLPFFGIAPRRNFFTFLALFAGLDFLARRTFNHIMAAGKFNRRALVVGLNPQSKQLVHLLNTNPQLGYQLEAILKVANFDQLEKIADEKKIDTIIISHEIYQAPKVIEPFYKLIRKKINFFHLSSFYEQISHEILLEQIDQTWFLENLMEGSKNFYEVSKRVLDIVFAAIFGLPTLVIFPFISLAAKLSSPGPIFYKQKRIGRYGKEFTIIKFRTMRNNAEHLSGPTWERANFSDITKVGGFLRKTHLDELPQLWNILKGEMSFVGPRAERPEFHEQLKSKVPFYEERYLIKPGPMGWAQIRNPTASAKDAAEKLQYDLFYIKHRSLILDFSIFLKTINIFFRQAGR